MIPKDVLKKIRRIHITTSRMVSDLFAGQYHSVFKGRGMEFDEVREYLAGDDVRTIDWNVTARFGHPFVKKFVEERELTVFFLVDASLSTYFGTHHNLKRQVIAELCSVLSLAAIKNNDRAGLIIFTDKIEKVVPARKGLRHVLRIIREALYFQPSGKKTDVAAALQYLLKVCKRKSVVFLISDFFSPDFKKILAVANKRHDVIALIVNDPREKELPDVGLVQLADPETGENWVIDTSDKKQRDDFSRNSRRIFAERKALLGSLGIDFIEVQTDVPYNKELFKFFRMRERRLR
jgi:uncharacterized protein (DUF58 family)